MLQGECQSIQQTSTLGASSLPSWLRAQRGPYKQWYEMVQEPLNLEQYILYMIQQNSPNDFRLVNMMTKILQDSS